MSEEPSTPGVNQPLSEEEVQAAASSPPPVPLSPDPTAMFMEAYECAKNNHSWMKVSSAISTNPEWLTRVPQGRRWTMLHQIVYCGSVIHLNEILVFQLSNEEFRLLCKALDDKTVREVAAERAHVHPQMMHRIERLVAMDQLLNNARDSKWDLVKTFIRQQPDIVNEKPPYRKYYLVHFLASTGQLDMFKELSNICHFKYDLLADNKTIVDIARENNFTEFAEHIETLQSNINEITETNNHNHNNNDDDTTPTDPYPTSQPFFSQGFYDDPGIMIFSLNPNSFGSMFLSQDESSSYPSHHQHHHHNSSHDHHFSTHSFFPGQHHPTTTTMITTNSSNEGNENNKKAKSILPTLTEEEQAEYEKTVMENVTKFSSNSLLEAVTCCITKGILRDPVVAADGFTYEREAILNWFEHSTRSPMTNQELGNTELKPNHAIKSILQTLTEKAKSQENSDEKSDETPKTNGDLAK